MDARLMRVLTAMLAVACLVFTGCRGPASAIGTPKQSPAHDSAAFACPGGAAAQPGLTNFGAYIGTWQANHHQDPKSPSDYTNATLNGRVSIKCSSSGYIVYEVISWTFQVPGGRALQFALTELPADSTKVYDHTHPGCRSLQYRSLQLAQQLHADDRNGLADVTLESPVATSEPVSIFLVLIQVATRFGDDSSSCL